MKKKVIENHKSYLERTELFKSFGYDPEKERDFIIDKALPFSEKILEVGSGKGHFALALAKRGYDLTSVDISEEEQEIASLNLQYFGMEKQIVFKIENAEELSFPDSSYDTVFSINTVHHLISPLKAVDEMIRVVSLYGKIILSDFTKEGFDIVDKINLQEGKKHEVGNIGLSEIGVYMREKGFKVEKYEDEYQEILVAYRQII